MGRDRGRVFDPPWPACESCSLNSASLTLSPVNGSCCWEELESARPRRNMRVGIVKSWRGAVEVQSPSVRPDRLAEGEKWVAEL